MTLPVFFDFLLDEGMIPERPMAKVKVKINKHQHTSCFDDAEADQILH